MLCTLGFSKTSLVQFDAPRMTLCGQFRLMWPSLPQL
jgi:hypothetical protein